MDWLSIPIVLKVLNWFHSRLALNREHDQAIFKKLDTIANEEKIDDVLNRGIFTRSIHLAEARLIEDFMLALQRYENQYIDDTLQLRAAELVWALGQLMSHVTKTFFSIGEGRLKFYPDLIDSEVFDADWKELEKTLEQAWDAYRKYRIAIKDRLMA